MHENGTSALHGIHVKRNFLSIISYTYKLWTASSEIICENNRQKRLKQLYYKHVPQQIQQVVNVTL